MLALIDRARGQMIGTSLYHFDPTFPDEIEMGSMFPGRAYWGSGANREVMRLMVGYALTLAEKVVFRVSSANLRSMTAKEKIGAALTDREEEWEFHSTLGPHLVY